MVTLIGLGGGTRSGMTAEAARALEEAEVLIGARRMLAAASESRAEKFAEYRAEEILAIIRENENKSIAVLFSGDTGFYSGAARLIGLLEREEIAFRVLPGLSSVQLLAARIGKPWQDWNLVSAHGTECDPVREVEKGKDVFFLTGGKETPGSICRELAEAGYGELRAVVGEELGYPEERVRRGSVRELAGEEFKGLSVLLVSRVKCANSVGKDTREGDVGTVPASLGTVPVAKGEVLDLSEEPKCGNSVGKDTREGDVGTVPASLGTVPEAKGEASASGRIMISAMGSGSGKTVVTCGLLTALRTRGVGCEAMKCGPDYIDPMFHAKVLGVPSRNLDLFLQGHDGVRRTLESRRESISVIEGAMGLFDGVGGTTEASAWEIAASCGIPVILAVKPGGSSATLAAQIRGLMTFREPNQIAGVILTACRESLYERLKPVIERETGLSVFGYLPPMKEAEIPSRHLGLMTADEVADLQERFGAVAEQMEKTVDIDGILALAGTAETKPEETAALEAVCRIAVARDEAFSFYYEDSFRALREAGAEITFFSPG
ncbi:MAG: cobyrinate a,c-diamide synthase, partial [Lachnospiraceae bacterium]|nr:cobyrinate a,c-diamide synthase [Lachnospiraceae bacterium]